MRLTSEVKPKGEGRIGLAFVGAGAFAQAVLLPAIAKIPNVEPIAIVSAGGLSAEHAGKKYGFAAAATEFEAAVSDPDVNAVVIATRHNLHASQVAASLRAGKHVFVEKPLALDREGLEEVREAYLAAGRVLMVGFNRRWSPQARRGEGAFLWHDPADFDKLPRQRRRRAAVELGAGRHRRVEGAYSAKCAILSTWRRIFAGSLPKSVFAAARAARARSPRMPTRVAVTMAFANGSVASIVYTSAGEPSFSKERVEVAARRKDGRDRGLPADGRRGPTAAASVAKTAQDKGHGAEMAAFFEAVKSGRQPVAFEEVYAVTAATIAVEESLATGRPVEL